MSVGPDLAQGSARFWGKSLDPYIWPVGMNNQEIRGFTGNYCLINDPVCNAAASPLDPVSVRAHIKGYSRAGWYMDQAAQFFYEKHVLDSGAP
jgi:hypothetical protein